MLPLLLLLVVVPACEAKVAKLDSHTFAKAVNVPGANSIVMFYAPW